MLKMAVKYNSIAPSEIRTPPNNGQTSCSKCVRYSEVPLYITHYTHVHTHTRTHIHTNTQKHTYKPKTQTHVTHMYKTHSITHHTCVHTHMYTYTPHTHTHNVYTHITHTVSHITCVHTQTCPHRLYTTCSYTYFKFRFSFVKQQLFKDIHSIVLSSKENSSPPCIL